MLKYLKKINKKQLMLQQIYIKWYDFFKNKNSFIIFHFILDKIKKTNYNKEGYMYNINIKNKLTNKNFIGCDII